MLDYYLRNCGHCERNFLMSFLCIFFIIAFCYNLFRRDLSIFKSLFNAALYTIALWFMMIVFWFIMLGGVYFLVLMAH